MNKEIATALRTAAERLANRPITEAENATLEKAFKESKADSDYLRSREALRVLFKISEERLIQLSAASDNTSRAIQDLKNIAEKWKK